MSARKMDCPVAVSCPLRLHLDLCPWVAGPVPSSQVLVLQVHWLGPEMLALVLFVRLLVPLLKEELRATGRSGISWRCHCRHFFCTSSCTWPQKSAISQGGKNKKDPVPRVLLTPLGPLHRPCHFLPSGQTLPSLTGQIDQFQPGCQGIESFLWV